MSEPITRDQLTIEHGTSNWGGPVIRIGLPNKLVESCSWPEDRVRTFELKHTKGLEGMSGRDKGHGWHVDDVGSSGGLSGWHGVLEMRDVDDPEAAIDEMLAYLNHLAVRDRVSTAVQPLISDLEEALRGFNESLEFRSYRDHNVEWPRVVDAVAAVDAAFRAAGGEQ